MAGSPLLCRGLDRASARAGRGAGATRVVSLSPVGTEVVLALGQRRTSRGGGRGVGAASGRARPPGDGERRGGAYAPDLVLVPAAEAAAARRAAPSAAHHRGRAARLRRRLGPVSVGRRRPGPRGGRAPLRARDVAAAGRARQRVLRQAPAARRGGAGAGAAGGRRRPQLRDRPDRAGGRRERHPRDGGAAARLVARRSSRARSRSWSWS